MKNLQKIGGMAALYEAVAYIVGMVGFLMVVDVAGVADPAAKVALIVDNQLFLSLLYLIVYVIWAIFLVVLALALYDRLKSGAPAMAQTATAFALIWAGLVLASATIYTIGMETVVTLQGKDPAQAATVWMTIESVCNGLSGLELVGGLWVLLISWAALRAGEFGRFLNYFGIVIAVFGILSVMPGLRMIVFVFALGQIVWFAWLGVVLLRKGEGALKDNTPFRPTYRPSSVAPS